MTSRMIGSVKVALITSRNLSESKAMVQDVPQAKMFQSKGNHSTVSPEELSGKLQIGLKQARETITKTTQILTCSDVTPLVRRYRAEIVSITRGSQAYGPQIPLTDG